MPPINRFKKIHVEINKKCNLSCSFCPIDGNETEQMSVDQFESVVRQLQGMTDEILLHILGEPLAHPDFPKFIECCQEYQLPVHIVSNGLLLGGARSEALLKPIVRQVSISLQSYEDNFPRGNPQTYLKKIKDFFDLAMRQRPELYLNLRLWDLAGFQAQNTANTSTTRNELAKIFDFQWEDINIDLRRKKNWHLRGRLYLHFDLRFEWPEINNDKLNDLGFCHGLGTHFGIHANGQVVPCCLDHKATIDLGNAFDTPLEKILTSERAKKIRQGFQNGKLVEELCKRCTYIDRFR